MTSDVLATVSEGDFPLAALVGEDRALAVIVGVEGTSYRPLGAAMAVDGAGRRTGNLSSGCIDEDVALHARQALEDREARQLRYGAGSPFADLALPCGGGLDILILPRPDRGSIRKALDQLAARQPARLDLEGVALHIQPELRFLVFGKGPEAATFADLARLTGFGVELFSPEAMDVPSGVTATPLVSPRWPEGVAIDPRTAVTLFFHDHDWEPPLLAAALSSSALYVGAQGSHRARQARRAALEAIGVPDRAIERLADPFGLIPSARDARTLAVAVLADVLARAKA
ncbi:XdhC family protein [Falsirhodobacter sp. 20TX0035]|uniref:XdhC family protein n=1 Tax=Falsirhodobacter sp. 20TX0035 TaxID=3022019 RepID=UPI00232D02B6|nr:XdhC family protein [Falsirhodobacter sp. 20TX0035]MDB6454336.1 XdhC family protein [Falsirhodobacter sp. 20TX0035]